MYKSSFTPPKAMSDAMLCILFKARNSLLSSKRLPAESGLQPLVPTLHAGRLNIGASYHSSSSSASQLAQTLVPGVKDDDDVERSPYEQHAVLQCTIWVLSSSSVLIPVSVPAPHLYLRRRIRRWVDRSGVSLARQHEQRFHRSDHRQSEWCSNADWMFGSMRHSRPLAQRRGDVVVSHAAQRLLHRDLRPVGWSQPTWRRRRRPGVSTARRDRHLRHHRPRRVRCRPG